MQHCSIFFISLFGVMVWSCGTPSSNYNTTAEQTAPTDSLTIQNNDLNHANAKPLSSTEENKDSVVQAKKTKSIAKNQDPDLPPSFYRGISYGIQEASENRIKLAPDTLMGEVLVLSVLQKRLQADAIKDTIRVRMYNYTKDTLTTGLHYTVKFLKEKQWQPVRRPERIAINDIGYRLLPDEACDFLIPLYPDFHTYQPGKYRIVKSYSLRDDNKPHKQYETIAEFEMR